jgi:hypothetical protein
MGHPQRAWPRRAWDYFNIDEGAVPPPQGPKTPSNASTITRDSNIVPLQATAAHQRNLTRFDDKKEENRRLIGKFISFETPIHNNISNNLDDTLPPPLILPQPTRPKNSPIPSIAQRISAMSHPTPSAPPLQFSISIAAANHNAKAISAYNYDLSQLVSDPRFTTTTPGAEFRPLSVLSELFCRHPLWPYMQDMLTQGAAMNFTKEPEDQQRHLENQALIEYQNHNKARNNADILAKTLAKEVHLGFACVIPINCIHLIKDAMVVPLGIVEQYSINNEGIRVPKLRLTHDQTFTRLPDSLSGNNLLDMQQFAEMIYGFCLNRIIHQILALRFTFPLHRIMIQKFDFAKAYRRVHYNGQAAARCISVLHELAYIQMRLSFGGAGCPPSWCVISEMITDLANELLDDEAWDTSLCVSPLQHLVPAPQRLPANIKIATAVQPQLQPPPYPHGKADTFVDDVILVFLDTAENCTRATAAVPLAIHLASRPMSDTEPIPREPFLSMEKLAAEGMPAEIQLVLGWQIDTRRLIIQLPEDKHRAWTRDITKIIEATRCTREEWASLVGRLNHAGFIIPKARHFLGRFRGRLMHAEKFNRFWVRMNKTLLKDLHLWLKFLNYARDGISLNLLGTPRPSNLLLTDSFPGGLGGYSITTGKGWRFDLGLWIHSTHNNILEFLAAVVGAWVETQTAAVPTLGCILNFTDNSTGEAWMHKSNFDPDISPIQAAIARKYAEICIDQNCTTMAQHFPGVRNKVADALSRQFTMTDSALTSYFHTHYPDQVPANFEICPLPPAISSWICSILSLKPASLTQEQNRPTKNMTAHGADGINSCANSASSTIPSWTSSHSPNGPPCVLPSSKPLEMGTSPTPSTQNSFAAIIQNRFLAGLSKKPLATWLRNSGTLTGQAPFTSTTVPTSFIQP